jgi:hypothetical protein
MNRRTLLASAGIAGLLAGCGARATAIVNDLPAIVGGLEKLFGNPAIAPLVPAPIAGKLGLARGGADAVTAAIAGGVDLTTLAGTLQATDEALNAVVAWAAGLTLPAGLSPILAAAAVLLPVAEGWINPIIIAKFGPKPAKASASFAVAMQVGSMTPAEARAVLGAR